MLDQNMVGLVQALIWPLVVVFGLLIFRNQVVTLATGATNLKELLGKTGDVATLLERLADLKREMDEIKATLETISISDQVRALRELARDQAQRAQEPELSVDEMYDQIAKVWKQVEEAIRSRAAAANVRSNLMGNVGVNATLDSLLEKGVITNRAAELTRPLSVQWQRMWRTTAPRGEWLTHNVYTSFVETAKEARKALLTDGG